MNRIMEHIGKYLPIFIKERVNSKTIWDKKLITDLMEFFSLSYDETICMLKFGRMLVISQWKILNPKTDDEIKKFYETVHYNVFSLAYWHMQYGQKRFRDNVIKNSFGDILDYGGGIGDLCIRLAENGLNVSYCDIKGHNMEFAKWLFKKRGYNIKVLDSSSVLEEYDTILCIDVIEHIPHPDTVLERLVSHLRSNGRLIITNLNCSGNDGTPLHIKMNFDAKKLLNSFGLYNTDNDWLWIKKDEENKNKFR